MPQDALKRGTLYTLFTPVVRLACQFGLPLKELRELLDIAYFEEHQRRGHTFKEMAESFDVSTRKITQLSQGLKGLLLVNDASKRFGLPRKLELMIWSQPMSDRRLGQVLVLEHEPEEITAALEVLVERGAIEFDRSAGVYRPVPRAKRAQTSVVPDDLLGRLDALKDFIDGVTDLVQARFFGGADGAPGDAPAHDEGDAEAPLSFVRTHNFYLLPEDVQYLVTKHEMLRLLLDQLEVRAEREVEQDGRDRRRGLSLVMMWAPRLRRGKSG